MKPARISFSAFCIGLVVSSCSGTSTQDGSTPSMVEGPVIGVESQGLGRVRAFSVKSGDDIYRIFIAENVDYNFPLDHLNEHRISGEPVVVDLEERTGKLYALSIEDA